MPLSRSSASGMPADGSRAPTRDEPVAVPREVRESMSVLVIDDEHTLRESCASLLRSEGFQVTVCGRGDEAETLIRRRPFDIMLVDLYMSQVSGMKLLEVARSEAPNALVILMTGNPSVETSIEGLRAGVYSTRRTQKEPVASLDLLSRATAALRQAQSGENGARIRAYEMS